MEGDQSGRPGPHRQPRTLHYPEVRPPRRTKGQAAGRPCSAPRLPSLRCPPAGLPGPRGFLPGTAALTAPARPACAGRRQRSCRGPSAAKPPPQLGPSTGALAPPIVKGPADGSPYKASAGARAARRCQSALAIQRGRATPSNRRPGRARCESVSAAPARCRAVSVCSPGSLSMPEGRSPAENLRWFPGEGKESCDASALRLKLGSADLSCSLTSEGLLSGIPPNPKPSKWALPAPVVVKFCSSLPSKPSTLRSSNSALLVAFASAIPSSCDWN